MTLCMNVWMKSEGRVSIEKKVIVAHLVLSSICSSAKGEATLMETRREGKENKTKNRTGEENDLEPKRLEC